MKRRLLRAAVAGVGLALGSGAARAHLASTGLGPVYDGVAHLFLSLDDLLPLVALALLAGLAGPAAGRRVLFALPLAWLCGGLLGFALALPEPPAAVTAVPLLALGLLVAANRPIGANAALGLATALGLLHGGLNGASIAAAGREAVALVGIAGAAFVLTAWLAAGVVAWRAPAARIAVRVAGSWLAATGLLMLGWSLAGAA